LTETHPSSREQLAIPLCLPDNCKWNPQTGKSIKTGNKRSSLCVIDEALEQLRKVKGKWRNSITVVIMSKEKAPGPGCLKPG